MRFRTTIILLLLALGAGLYLALVDRGKPSTEELKRIEKRVFKEFEPEKITRIIVEIAERENETGKVVKTVEFDIERDPVGWKILKPVSFPADGSRIRQILDFVKKIDQSRLVVGEDYKALDRKGTGLDEPDVIATFETPATSITVRIGLTEPVGWDNYVEVAGRDAVYFVPSQFKDTLSLKTDNSSQDVRRRNVFDVRKYMVNSLVMEHPAYSVELRRGDDLTWRMTQPVNDAAEGDKVEKMIEKIADFTVESFVEAPSNFGRPRLTLAVIQGAMSQRLQVGNKTGPEDKDCFARRGEYQQYITIHESDIELFMEKPNDYRSKLLIIKNEFQDPVHLTQTADGDTMEFDFKDEAWTIPGLATALEDELEVEDYVYLWQELTVTGFVDAAQAGLALSDVWIKLTFKFKGLPEPLELSLSRPKDGLVYAERTPGIFVTLDESAVRELLATNEFRFLNKEVVNIPADSIAEVTIQKGTRAFKLLKGTNQWVSIITNAALSIDADVSADLEKSLPVVVSEYVANTMKQPGDLLARYGLSPAYQTFSFTDTGGKSATISIGNEYKYGNRYAMLTGEPYVFVISQEAYNKLALLAEDAIMVSDDQ